VLILVVGHILAIELCRLFLGKVVEVQPNKVIETSGTLSLS
jgi:hypothetical protein